MQLYPAIDLKGGCVVRCLEGKTTRETVYGDDPFKTATYFVDQGAEWLHVVDMDRAFRTGGDNLERIRRIAQIPEVRIQVGGNIDSVEWARDAMAIGASRVVIGTRAALDAELFQSLVREVGPDRCAVAIDVRDGNLALRASDVPVTLSTEAVVQRALNVGVRTIVYRDLARDGLVMGANIGGAAAIAPLDVDVILAGGVAGLDDIELASRSGMAGVIVGRALYEDRFTLREAIECSR